MRLAIIGTGNMGKALINGFISSGVVSSDSITVYDAYMPALDAAVSKFGVNKANSANEAVKDADYVLMAVKPQQFDEVLSGITPDLDDKTVVLSIAAAVKTERILNIVGTNRKIVRIMPLQVQSDIHHILNQSLSVY